MGCGLAGGPVTSSKIVAKIVAILDFTQNKKLSKQMLCCFQSTFSQSIVKMCPGVQPLKTAGADKKFSPAVRLKTNGCALW